MPDFLKQNFEKLIQYWSNRSAAQRMLLVGLAVSTVAAVLVMMLFADAISHFVSRHPTVQMLALSFLILIGVFLVAEGLGRHIDRGYIYFAMAFSLLVELLNMRARRAGGDN